MSDLEVQFLADIIRLYLRRKHAEYAATVAALDGMDVRDSADISYARQQRTWRKHAMAGLKKAFADCTERNLRRILVEARVIDERSISGDGQGASGSSVLPFPATES